MRLRTVWKDDIQRGRPSRLPIVREVVQPRSEELARLLSKEKIIEVPTLRFGHKNAVVFSHKDLDAKVTELQPCIASCDENLARSLDTNLATSCRMGGDMFSRCHGT